MYGSIVWITTFKTNLTPFQILQNKATRNLFNLDNNETTNHINKKYQILRFNKNTKYLESINMQTIYYQHTYIIWPIIMHTIKYKNDTKQ